MPMMMVEDPNTSAGSGRQLAPSTETHDGVRHPSSVITGAPRAMNPPRHRSTARTWANGSSASSRRQSIPVHAAPVAGGGLVTKPVSAAVDGAGSIGPLVGEDAGVPLAGPDSARPGGPPAADMPTMAPATSALMTNVAVWGRTCSTGCLLRWPGTMPDPRARRRQRCQWTTRYVRAQGTIAHRT